MKQNKKQKRERSEMILCPICAERGVESVVESYVKTTENDEVHRVVLMCPECHGWRCYRPPEAQVVIHEIHWMELTPRDHIIWDWFNTWDEPMMRRHVLTEEPAAERATPPTTSLPIRPIPTRPSQGCPPSTLPPSHRPGERDLGRE